MAEALGVASGVAGLLSLGLELCHEILAYYDGVMSFDEDVKRMCSSIKDVNKILRVIENTLTKGTFSADTIEIVETSISRCTEGLATLQKKLGKIRANDPDGTFKTKLEYTKKRLLYPFKESTLAKLRELCGNLQDNLGLALNALNM